MKKSLFAVMLLLMLSLACLSGAASGEIIPPLGMGQTGYEAVVLCQSLTVREGRDTASKAVTVLHAGDRLVTFSTVDGWCDCFLHENEGRTGWVKADYVAVDPAWYRVEKSTPVYAWDSESAARVGLLDAGEKYPVLMARDEWVVIGLRGASGWIHDAHGARDVLKAVFSPDKLRSVVRADLSMPDGTEYSLTDSEKLQWIRQNFARAEKVTPTGCPFNAKLFLTLEDDTVIPLAMATDTCRTFRTHNGVYYHYGPADAEESFATVQAFWALFGLDPSTLR